MSLPYCYKYPRPAVTVDLVVFALGDDGLRILLIRRKHDPFAGCWAIPGGFLEMDESAEDASRRELREETGLDHRGLVAPIGFFSAPGRDPRGRTISLAHAGVVRGPLPRVGGGDDAAEAAWLGLQHATGLAFDHDAILAAALRWFVNAVDEGPAGVAILPQPFQQEDVRDLFRALGRTRGQAVAWRNRLVRSGQIVHEPGTRTRYRGRSD
jgi:8-oxo-dGTP diphosphatase